MNKMSLAVLFFVFLMTPRLQAAQSFYNLSATSIDGQLKPLSEYKGQVLLVVNTASGCGYTPQYEGLQALQKKYLGQKFTVLGFPSNDFGGQEPGTNAEIKTFCQLNYKVSFPMFSKAPVTGASIQPVFKWLTVEANSKLAGAVEWNFEKFLIGRDGNLIKRFKSAVTPESQELVSVLEAALKNK